MVEVEGVKADEVAGPVEEAITLPQQVKQKGLCAALGECVFNYGQKGAADQMRTTWTRIVHHVGMIHGHDISKELLNRTRITVPKPLYPSEMLHTHAASEVMREL